VIPAKPGDVSWRRYQSAPRAVSNAPRSSSGCELFCVIGSPKSGSLDTARGADPSVVESLRRRRDMIPPPYS